MKSLRQLRSDLVDVRLQANNASVWSMVTTVTRKANQAINDAIATYKFSVEGIYSSVALTSGPSVIALPQDIGRIIRIEAAGDTSRARRAITVYNHVPTAQTNLLYLNQSAASANVLSGNNVTPVEKLDIIYEYRQEALPADIVVIGNGLTTVGGDLTVSGGSPAAVWRSPGYLELSVPLETSDIREIVRYDLALPTGFTGLTRNIEGMLWHWTGGSVISAVYEAKEETVPVLMASAQATMYDFWIRHRALYDQYNLAAGVPPLDAKELLQISTSYERRADLKYRRIMTLPKPSHIKARRIRG